MSVQNNEDEIKLLKEMLADPYGETFDGVMAVGDVLTPELLVYAYERGVFPWPHEGYPLLWFSPDQRGVLDFQDLHLSKSYQKWLKKNKAHFELKMNTAFRDVMIACQQQVRKGQSGTWITDEMVDCYSELFKMGGAFSFEVWRDRQLVGGIYGVKSKKYYSCESMFHAEDNTSKLALHGLIVELKSRGVEWLDIQMVTNVCESFGGKLISKKKFLKRIGY